MDRSLIFVPLLIFIIILYAFIKKKNAYESFLDGARNGLDLFKEVFPSILAMMLLVNLLKSSGMIDDLAKLLSKTIPSLGEYTEIIPMAIFRPISGSASVAVLDSIIKKGPDSFLAKMASAIQGSTDTTIYVICLYFSSVKIKKYKHAIGVGLIADLIGIISGISLSFLFLR